MLCAEMYCFLRLLVGVCSAVFGVCCLSVVVWCCCTLFDVVDRRRLLLVVCCLLFGVLLLLLWFVVSCLQLVGCCLGLCGGVC